VFVVNNGDRKVYEISGSGYAYNTVRVGAFPNPGTYV
jgi:hypothetical protein